MAAARLRRLLAEDRPAIRSYDEAEFARRLHYDRPVESSLRLLESLLQANLELLDSLGDAEWDREGSHDELGAYSVDVLVRRSADHFPLHAEQIEATWRAVRPDDRARQDALILRLRREGEAGRRAYQILIELTDVTPPVWRRLVVADTAPLPVFHRIIQTAFGWQDRHLHEFRVGQVRIGEPDDEGVLAPAIDEESVRLYQILADVGDRALYEYDFGDGWTHDILLEDMWEVEERPVPQCTAGERAGPPEDCGGPSGYRRLMAALADPSDEEHERLRAWAGRFSPGRCDLELIDRRLARLARGRNPGGWRRPPRPSRGPAFTTPGDTE
jgi:hypothetical protein